ncbi:MULTISPECIES: YHS domain-containing (seleno)protein [Alphaproteobacteria]|uniref:YHS domain-containing (seleno)protein n=1 Tax=Alphaproteobacteria TaxID=28211 RepID=UPI0012BC9C88|nr:MULTISPECIES: YHS domain-containing (seleno)protein [Alphaproteobacteria]
MLSRRSLIASFAAALFASALHAQDRPVFYADDGLAMAGYDAVSYFDEGVPTRGQPEIAVMWKGAEWHFASQENRERFESNPRAFAPQFGGYCAYAMTYGSLSSTDPNAWKIVEGRLYLTHSPAIERMWDRNLTQNIRMAEEYWPAVLYKN